VSGESEPGDPARDDVAAALIAELESDGEFIAHGRFTLDFAKARSKLASFSLEQPSKFLLLFVEAAHLFSDCTAVRFEHERRATRVSFDGVALTPEQLRAPFDAVLADTDGLEPEQARRQQAIARIALAIETALRGPCSHVELRSNRSAEAPLCVTLTAEGRTEVTATDVALADATLTVLLSEGPNRRRREHDLELSDCWLRTSECEHARVPIFVNGRQNQPEGLRAVDHPVELRDQGTLFGLAGVSKQRKSPRIPLVANGVTVEWIWETEWNPRFVGVLYFDDLARDLSLSSFRRDARFEARMAILRATYATLKFPDDAVDPLAVECLGSAAVHRYNGVWLLLACGLVLGGIRLWATGHPVGSVLLLLIAIAPIRALVISIIDAWTHAFGEEMIATIERVEFSRVEQRNKQLHANMHLWIHAAEPTSRFLSVEIYKVQHERFAAGVHLWVRGWLRGWSWGLGRLVLAKRQRHPEP
jgi:hypothetical protein